MEPKEETREKNSLNNFEKSKLIFATALLATTLNPKEIKNPETYHEPVPISQPLGSFEQYGTDSTAEDSYFDSLISLNSPSPSYLGPLREFSAEPVFEEEIEKLDLGEYEFPLLSEYSLFSIENIKENNIVQTEQNTLLYFIPLDSNNEVIDYSEAKQFVVKAGMNFEIAQKRVLIDKEGNKVEIQLLGNTFGKENFVAAILTGFEKNDSKKIELVSNNSEEIEEISTYIATENSAYPNKVLNVLKALGYLTDVGQLKKDETYSYLSIIGLDNINILRTYEYGRNSGESILLAGGVCASTTALSSLLYQVNDVEVLPLGIGRWVHSFLPYDQGPFSPYWKDVDAAIAYNAKEGIRYDFIWKMKRDGYIKIDAEIFPTGLEYSETDENGLGYVSDVNAIISLAFTEKEPIGQKEELQYLFDKYSQYRESQHEETLPFQDQLQEKTYIQNRKIKRVIDLLYIKTKPDKTYDVKDLNGINSNSDSNIR